MRRESLSAMTAAFALAGTAASAGSVPPTPIPTASIPAAAIAAAPLPPPAATSAPPPVAALPAPSVADDPADAPPGAERLELAPDQTRLTLAVTVGGRGPYRFIVDTGAERSVISSALAGALALQPGATQRIVTMAGRAAVPTALIPRLQLSAARSVRDVRAPVLAAADIGADGMLGIDALRAQHVVFDFRGGSMTIAAPERRHSDPDEIVVTARTRRGRLVLGEGRVERLRADVVLDTGAEITIGNEALRRALAARRRLPPVMQGEIVTITGQRLKVDLIAVRALAVGTLTFKNMPIAFLDSAAFTELGLGERPALLLGMDALKLFDRVSVDFGARVVRFLPPSAAAPPSARVAATQTARAPS